MQINYRVRCGEEHELYRGVEKMVPDHDGCVMKLFEFRLVPPSNIFKTKVFPGQRCLPLKEKKIRHRNASSYDT